MTGFDHDRVSHAIGTALSGPGGVAWSSGCFAEFRE